MTYLVAFLGGLAGSAHCLGMCGGFPIALAAGGHGRPVLRQAVYNLGRLNTLVVVGALSGALGASLVATVAVRAAERALALVAGTAMVLIGLEVLGVVGGLTRYPAAAVQGWIRRPLAGVMRSPSLAAPLALGVFNALLPCQLIWAFAARAAATASIGAGMLTMLAFGFGTVPAMFALPFVGARVSPTAAAWVTRAGALLVIGFGLVTAARGLAAAPICPAH